MEKIKIKQEMVDLELLKENPDQPRKSYDDSEIQTLAENINLGLKY